MVVKCSYWKEYPICKVEERAMMQGSMETKLTMVFVPLVLQRCSKPMYQSRLSKKGLGTIL